MVQNQPGHWKKWEFTSKTRQENVAMMAPDVNSPLHQAGVDLVGV
jgi:hypothetical protein